MNQPPKTLFFRIIQTTQYKDDDKYSVGRTKRSMPNKVLKDYVGHASFCPTYIAKKQNFHMTFSKFTWEQ